GERIQLVCDSCGSTGRYHVNEIKAEISKIVAVIAGAIFLGGTAGTLFFVWDYLFEKANIYAISGLIGLATIPFIFYQGINRHQTGRVTYFNTKRYG
ncbi:MAG: hypothetical protein RIB86_23695, partial [Imperialibacter sp.]